jgi:hypothetical protein
MSNSKFEKQLQACARTEEGIINMTFLFKGYLGNKNHGKINNEKTEKVIEKYEEIESLTKKLANLTSDSYNNRSQIMTLEDDIEDIFKEIASIINDSLKESFVIVHKSNSNKFK